MLRSAITPSSLPLLFAHDVTSLPDFFSFSDNEDSLRLLRRPSAIIGSLSPVTSSTNVSYIATTRQLSETVRQSLPLQDRAIDDALAAQIDMVSQYCFSISHSIGMKLHTAFLPFTQYLIFGHPRTFSNFTERF